MYQYIDRKDAGRHLAGQLGAYRHSNAIVLGLPRGGVIVGAEVARELNLPFEVIMVRKLGLPQIPEVAMGAIAEGGVVYLNRSLIDQCGVSDEEISDVERVQRGILKSRGDLFRRGRPRTDLRGRTAIIVDDGIATGATARVACKAARNLGASTVVLAAPVAAADTLRDFAEADSIVCDLVVERFAAVGDHYARFPQTTNDEVIEALNSSTALGSIRASTSTSSP